MKGAFSKVACDLRLWAEQFGHVSTYERKADEPVKFAILVEGGELITVTLERSHVDD